MAIFLVFQCLPTKEIKSDGPYKNIALLIQPILLSIYSRIMAYSCWLVRGAEFNSTRLFYRRTVGIKMRLASLLEQEVVCVYVQYSCKNILDTILSAQELSAWHLISRDTVEFEIITVATILVLMMNQHEEKNLPHQKDKGNSLTRDLKFIKSRDFFWK